MPYRAGGGLPAETASKLGHLDVLQSSLVQQLCQNFKKPVIPVACKNIGWENIPDSGTPLRYYIGIDGSYQTVSSEESPFSKITFVKTALVQLDQHALDKINQDTPHPFELRDLMRKSAIYHATVFPLQNISFPDMNYMNNYHAIRHIIYDSLKDPSPQMKGQVMETLKWLAYQKWGDDERDLTEFECPHCGKLTTLPFDAEKGRCNEDRCNEEIFLSDWLGFHLEMTDDSAPEQIASSYMSVHETLLLMTIIRDYWENNRDKISECLFIKDGPLAVRAQYSKIVDPIRRFLIFAQSKGYPIHILGQEKSGGFYDHFQFISKEVPSKTFFIPGNDYIKKQIQRRPDTVAIYGKFTNYGTKIFAKFNEYQKIVLNIPINPPTNVNPDPKLGDVIGIERIFKTIPLLFTYRHDGGLLPIELAHSVASLSTYPSAEILKRYTESQQ
ncbi:hypothetical protein [Methanoregula sp.]|uniref:hypothetical protein n=1 Tax=Methanoregula sp. TaxID=2052170 RepID=UPI002C183D5C|nr:hypothetical protein [Methanoregula sp.]HVP96751.1 hypothetical protein [Methanoregula sp.]